METNYAIVIDAEGYKVAFVIVDRGLPLYYTLQPGETLITHDWQKANAMLKPRWTGSAWEETATTEEIEAARPKPKEPPPSDLEMLAAEVSLALCQMQSNYDLALAEMSILIAGGK